ncbi:DUF6929 family protein [Methyloterricola oryzae]|uniref:DUF6929 family protein n=1 Tax=Methyloterricola oryzae TaxID=1495050 RepID=UPI0005EBBE22|nr:hypothetical protein [Methyloterricola oryzae]
MDSCLVSRRDPELRATIVSRTPLLYAEGADHRADRPAHVRAGSSLSWFNQRLAVVQDDANFIALIDPPSGHVEALTLPRGHEGLRQFDDLRGNKRHKLDLEACLTVPGCGGESLLVLASGSKKQRDAVVRVDSDGRLRLQRAPELYRRLRKTEAFAGSQLNLEGAIYRDGSVRLFNRGNGEARDGLQPVNAICDLDWEELKDYLDDPDEKRVPKPGGIRRYDLGNLRGVRLTFTDATVSTQGLLYVASAENTEDAVSDGPVAGSAVGLLGDDGEARWTALCEANGSLSAAKVEGICTGAGAGEIYLTVDADDPAQPSELLKVALTGPWD